MRLKNFAKVAARLAAPLLMAGVGAGVTAFQSAAIVERKSLPFHFGSMSTSTVVNDSKRLVPLESVNLQFNLLPKRQRWVF